MLLIQHTRGAGVGEAERREGEWVGGERETRGEGGRGI